MAKSGINRQEIARMARDIQREFDKHPIRVPVEANVARGVASQNVYNGPVFFGDANGAQLAWNNEVADQRQIREVAPGFEQTAAVVADVLRDVARAQLPEEQRLLAEECGREVLDEVTSDAPQQSKVGRGIAVLRGVFAPIALGAHAGVGDAARAWARTAVERLTGL
jgi:hypothetical protein